MKPHTNGHRIKEPADCKCQRDDERCPTCDWGLAVCADCGAAEVQLDAICPAAFHEIVKAAEQVKSDLHCDYSPNATEYPDPYVTAGTSVRLSEAIRRCKGEPPLLDITSD